MAYTTIDDPSVHFQTEIYTDGDATTNDTTSQTFDGNSDLQPDFMWFKSRNVVGNHGWMDTSRGKDGGTSFKTLFVTTAAERTSSSGYDLTSMNSDGFSYGRPNQLDWAHDTPAQNVVWAWAANGGTATATGSESGSNPAYSVQANTTAGFSVVTYTGTGSNGTVPHGLGVKPDWYIIKNRDNSNADDGRWMVWHKSLEEAHNYYSFLFLHLTNSRSEGTTVVNATPNTTTFALGNDGMVNNDGEKYVAYCFAEKQGYSKFGSYSGNGNANGPFIHTGFKPAFYLWKRIDGSSEWFILDNKRDTGNITEVSLKADTTEAESIGNGYNGVDFLSNGVKVRQSNSSINNSSGTYIYMAFAENPFVSSKGVPTTAR